MITWPAALLTAPAGGGDDYWPDPAVPTRPEPDRRPDVLVVGAGIAGAAAAHACARAGLRVQVLDRGAPAGGTTRRSAGGLVPDVHAGRVPPLLTALGRRGLLLHRTLAADLGHRLGTMDWLELDDDRHGDRANGRDGRRGRAEPDHGDPRPQGPEGGERLDAAEVARLLPGLAGPRPGRLVRDQAQVDPVEVAASLLRTVPVTPGVEVTACRPAGDGVEVRTSVGTLHAGRVVVATGQLPAPLADRVQGVRGHLLVVDAPPDTLSDGLAVGGPLVLLPGLHGGLIAGGTRDGSTPASRPLPDVVAGVRTRLGRLLPRAAEAPLRAAWVGFRPAVGDGLPVVDRVDDGGRIVVIGGLYHTGVLLAPAVGELVAGALTREAEPPAQLSLDRPLG